MIREMNFMKEKRKFRPQKQNSHRKKLKNYLGDVKFITTKNVTIHVFYTKGKTILGKTIKNNLSIVLKTSL